MRAASAERVGESADEARHPPPGCLDHHRSRGTGNGTVPTLCLYLAPVCLIVVPWPAVMSNTFHFTGPTAQSESESRLPEATIRGREDVDEVSRLDAFIFEFKKFKFCYAYLGSCREGEQHWEMR